MIPRTKPDIGWSDLLFAIRGCLRPGSGTEGLHSLESRGFPGSDVLACLSVRSGFDLMLGALELPAGSEIVMSGVNIPDMTRIVEEHGLVPVPVDVDMNRLTVESQEVEAAVTSRTRMILIAHLFGSRMPLDEVAQIAARRGALLVEDCAHAFAGPDYVGHPESHAVMFSFGPTKPGTALGGALLDVRSPRLFRRMRALHQAWPAATRRWYLRRVLSALAQKVVARPFGFRSLGAVARALGADVDSLLTWGDDDLDGSELFRWIRRRPPEPLLRTLAHRLETFDAETTARRRKAATRAFRVLPEVFRPGSHATDHSHWATPVWVPRPDEVVARLRREGIDATRGVGRLDAVHPSGSPGAAPTEARRWMSNLVYLPLDPDVGFPALLRMRKVLYETRDGTSHGTEAVRQLHPRSRTRSTRSPRAPSPSFE